MLSKYLIIILITLIPATTAAVTNSILATMNVRYEQISDYNVKFLQFNVKRFKEFYDCLCHDDSQECVISYSLEGYSVTGISIKTSASTTAPKVFTCRNYSNTARVHCSLVASSNLKEHQHLQNFTYTTQPKCCTGILWEIEAEKITFSTNQTFYTNCSVSESINSTTPAQRTTTLSVTTTGLAISRPQVQETSTEVSSTWASAYLTLPGDNYQGDLSKDENSIPVIIIGVVVAIVVIIILIVIVFIIWRRRRGASHQHGNNTTTSSTNILTEIRLSPDHSRACEDPSPKQNLEQIDAKCNNVNSKNVVNYTNTIPHIILDAGFNDHKKNAVIPDNIYSKAKPVGTQNAKDFMYEEVDLKSTEKNLGKKYDYAQVHKKSGNSNALMSLNDIAMSSTIVSNQQFLADKQVKDDQTTGWKVNIAGNNNTNLPPLSSAHKYGDTEPTNLRTDYESVDQYEIQTSEIGIGPSIHDGYTEIENNANIGEGDDYDYSVIGNESSASKASREKITNTDYDYIGDVRPSATTISTTEDIDEHYSSVGNHDNLIKMANPSDRSIDLYSKLGQPSRNPANPYNDLLTPNADCSSESKKSNDKSNFAGEKLELADVNCTKHYTNLGTMSSPSDRSTDLYSKLGQTTRNVTNPYNDLLTSNKDSFSERKTFNDKRNSAEEKPEYAAANTTKGQSETEKRLHP